MNLTDLEKATSELSNVGITDLEFHKDDNDTEGPRIFSFKLKDKRLWGSARIKKDKNKKDRIFGISLTMIVSIEMDLSLEDILNAVNIANANDKNGCSITYNDTINGFAISSSSHILPDSFYKDVEGKSPLAPTILWQIVSLFDSSKEVFSIVSEIGNNTLNSENNKENPNV